MVCDGGGRHQPGLSGQSERLPKFLANFVGVLIDVVLHGRLDTLVAHQRLQCGRLHQGWPRGVTQPTDYRLAQQPNRSHAAERYRCQGEYHEQFSQAESEPGAWLEQHGGRGKHVH